MVSYDVSLDEKKEVKNVTHTQIIYNKCLGKPMTLLVVGNHDDDDDDNHLLYIYIVYHDSHI